MRNVWKKIVGLTLAACTLTSACVVGAAEPTKGEPISANIRGGEIVPMASDIVVNTSIVGSTISWYQRPGYPSYRVWVDNTTGTLMTVTITEPSGEREKFFVPADTNKSYTVNDAEDGFYDILFESYADKLSGTIRIRVSETPL